MRVTAGRERKSAGKAIDGGGIGIVTIVSIHIISSQLLYRAFRRKSKTACSGSLASPLASDLACLKEEVRGAWPLSFSGHFDW